MSASTIFLFDSVQKCDVVRLHVVGSPGQQKLRAKLLRIYSARRGVDLSWLDTEIEFVGGPPHWGAALLEVGEDAVVFIRSINGRLYEVAWNGHMAVGPIDGEEYAIYPHRELWLSNTLPESIRTHSRPDPNVLIQAQFS
jgi:hypothetical protein